MITTCIQTMIGLWAKRSATTPPTGAMNTWATPVISRTALSMNSDSVSRQVSQLVATSMLWNPMPLPTNDTM